MTYGFESYYMPLRQLVVTQTLDIKSQLKAGIRAFDMRVRLENDQFLCFHSGKIEDLYNSAGNVLHGYALIVTH